MIQHHGTLTAGGSGLFAFLSALSFWQGVSIAVTIISGLVAITLGMLSLYDRLKYGPRVLR